MSLWDKTNHSISQIYIHYRWVLTYLCVLPLNFMCDVYTSFLSRQFFLWKSGSESHDKRVANVQKQVNEWIRQGRETQMCTARPCWESMSFRTRYICKSTCFNVKVDLSDILEIDTNRQVIRVEPLVTIGQLIRKLEPEGWTIPVVPELDDLTIGGLVMGCGIGTSSHKYGLFQHTCVLYELVLADGQLITCTKESNPDLFYSIPWSYGTLGFLTAIEIKIIPAKRFVKLEYYPTYGLSQTFVQFQQQSSNQQGNDFVEAIMYRKNQAVVMVGNMVNSTEPGKLNQFGLYDKPWFYRHVESFLKTGYGVEYIPLNDYLRRHSRSLFWEMQNIIPFGNNVIFRKLFGWLLPPNISLLKKTMPQITKDLYADKRIFRDMIVPICTLKDTIQYLDQKANIYPMRLSPFKLGNAPGFVRNVNNASEIYVDIGLYGVVKTETYTAEYITKRLESYLREVNGFQMLYADICMTRSQFREMFDHQLYDKMRTKYQCRSAFPEVYDKVCRSAKN